VSRLGSFTRSLACVLALLCFAGTGAGCSEDTSKREQPLDTRLETHAVLTGKPSAEGLAYVQAIVDAHQQADALTERQARVDRLSLALELEPPPGDGTAELLRYELLARTAELLLEGGEAERALALLEPQLATSVSLPLDRAAARCLIGLGDAAAQTGDHALAMGSYARALELLSLLLEEVEP
jgi:tetratricopeptide (TPR) repeat protein